MHYEQKVYVSLFRITTGLPVPYFGESDAKYKRIQTRAELEKLAKRRIKW